MILLPFFDAGTLSELRETKKSCVELNGKKILLFFLKGKVLAVDAVCPHQGGPLENCELDDEEIICPLHAYMFNVKSGECLTYPTYSLQKYEVNIDHDLIKIKIE